MESAFSILTSSLPPKSLMIVSLVFKTSLATKQSQKLEIDMFYAALADNSPSCNFLVSLNLTQHF